MNESASRRPTEREEPQVGIFWRVPVGAKHVLISDGVPLSRAEPYGDCLTHPRGHYELWEEWQQLGIIQLRRKALPSQILRHEYEEFPRGRIVYETTAGRFNIYIDRKLFVADLVTAIKARFGLRDQPSLIHFDPHYRTVRS